MSLPENVTALPADTPCPRPGHPWWCQEDEINAPGPQHPLAGTRRSIVAVLQHMAPGPIGEDGRRSRVELGREDILELDENGAPILTHGTPAVHVGEVSLTGFLDVQEARELAIDLQEAARILGGGRRA